jgi:DNA primase
VTGHAGHSDVDLVREATDLVQLIGEHVALRPQGREHVGLCPFHDDRRPSMHVVTHKGTAFYKCFACGASGDCITFIREFHKLEFREALQMLADRAGIELTGRREEPVGDGPRRSDLRKANEFAAGFYHDLLADPAAEAARAALADRGIDEAMIERFRLGACPATPGALHARLRTKASAVRTAEAAGLIRQRAGTWYDTFRNRIIFPICGDTGQVVALGGRIVDPADSPKYLNSPESPLFNKSSTLYGLHLAKRAIADSGRAIVTEGYTDVIACHQAGITNVVGTLGTALTTEHAAILRRFCHTVVLVFDGDEAGRKAADRGIQVFFAEPVDVRICILPEGSDPDGLLRMEGGPDQFRAAVGSALDALEYKLSRFLGGLGDTDSIASRFQQGERFLRELADLGIGAMPGDRKRPVLMRIADLLQWPLEDVERALRKLGAPRRPAAAASSTESPDASLFEEESSAVVRRGRRKAEQAVLAVLLFEPAAGRIEIETAEGPRRLTETITTSSFADPIAARLAGVLMPRLREGGSGPSMPEVLAELPEEAERGLASRLFFEGQAACNGDEDRAAAVVQNVVTDLLDCMAREAYEHQLARSRAAARAGGEPDPEQVVELIRKRQAHDVLPAAITRGVRS